MIVRSRKDLGAGILYIVIGASFTWAAANYRMGTPASMGPGYFPFWLGVVLTIIGVMVAAGAVARTGSPDCDNIRVDLRGLASILISVVAFGLLLKPGGLGIAVAATVLLSSLAHRDIRPVPTMILTLTLSLLSVIVFVYGLGLQFQVLPAFLTE